MGHVPMKKAQEIRRAKPRETKCNYCKRTIKGAEVTADHVIPIIEGGGHGWDNIIWCCIICNQLKSGVQVDYFLDALELMPISHRVPLAMDEESKNARRRYQSFWIKAVRRMKKILANETLLSEDGV